MFFVYGGKSMSYQTRARPIPLSPTGALGYSALEFRNVQTTESEMKTSTGDAGNDSIKLQLDSALSAIPLLPEGWVFQPSEHR